MALSSHQEHLRLLAGSPRIPLLLAHAGGICGPVVQLLRYLSIAHLSLCLFCFVQNVTSAPGCPALFGMSARV